MAAMAHPAYAAGDAAAGETIFGHTCALCHQIGPTAKNFVGPELNGLNGRKAGTVAGYDYSDAMKKSGVTWGEDSFKKYITNPQADIPGVKMIFAGLDKHSQARQHLGLYFAVQGGRLQISGRHAARDAKRSGPRRSVFVLAQRSFGGSATADEHAARWIVSQDRRAEEDDKTAGDDA